MIARIEELLLALTPSEEPPLVSTTTNHSYAELLALYEKEKNTCLEMESSFGLKSKEANKNIENMNKEMNNLATIIDDLRKQYLNMQK